MYLVLCHSNDHAAIWAWQALGAAGLPRVELVTTEGLASIRGWKHSLGDGGAVDTSFRLPDGRVATEADIEGVLNRLSAPPHEITAHAAPNDRDYAQQELAAFYLSWLHSLGGRVINPPTAQGLGGRWRHASEWALLAHRAGLRTPVYRQSHRDRDDLGYASLAPAGADVLRILVAGGEAFGPALPLAVRESCVELGALAETPLLGVDVYREPAGWRFANATPLPDLTIGGSAFARRLALCLRRPETLQPAHARKGELR
ncbi:MAG: hypothetical protein JSR81_03655 [Proteobacteria bacterium]|nr:hypothetical protein [Pseudomonadota bacterium]